MLGKLFQLFQEAEPVAPPVRQEGNPCAAAESVPVLRARFENSFGKGAHGGYPAPPRSTFQQQVDRAMAADCKGLAPAEDLPLCDTRFDVEEDCSDPFPAFGEKEEPDIAEELATKRKGIQEGETCLQADGTLATAEEGRTEATSAKKARPAQATGQELAEELAALEEQRAGLQEVAGGNDSGATSAHAPAAEAPPSAEQHLG